VKTRVLPYPGRFDQPALLRVVQNDDLLIMLGRVEPTEQAEGRPADTGKMGSDRPRVNPDAHLSSPHHRYFT
jgi:hypothetical protein